MQPAQKSADEPENKATIILPQEGLSVKAGEGSCTFKVTSDMSHGTLGIFEIVIPPHTDGARVHYHQLMDEVFIVKKGSLRIVLGDTNHDLEEGATAYVPRLTVHGFSNVSDQPTVIILIFNPSEQREGYFIGLFELLNEEQFDVPRFLQLAEKYDTHLVMP